MEDGQIQFNMPCWVLGRAPGIRVQRSALAPPGATNNTKSVVFGYFGEWKFYSPVMGCKSPKHYFLGILQGQVFLHHTQHLLTQGTAEEHSQLLQAPTGVTKMEHG